MTQPDTAEADKIDAAWNAADEAERRSAALIAEFVADGATQQQARNAVRVAVADVRAGAVELDMFATRAFEAMSYEYAADGTPQVYPFNDSASLVVQRWVDAGKPSTGDLAAHVASIKSAREGFRAGHTRSCRGDLYRGLCH